MYVWDGAGKVAKKQKGLFGKFAMTSFSCVAWDNRGRAFAGGANSSVYVFTGRNCTGKIDCHQGGFVSALTWADGFILSGAKDGKVFKIENAKNTTLVG